MGYSRKKKQIGGWGYGISRGIGEIASGFSKELIENNVEFPGVIKKEFPGVLALGLKISEECKTIWWSF